MSPRCLWRWRLWPRWRRASDAPAVAARFAPSTPVRALAVYGWVVVALNTLAFLRGILPALGSSGAPES
jgi:hypothetical protein